MGDFIPTQGPGRYRAVISEGGCGIETDAVFDGYEWRVGGSLVPAGYVISAAPISVGNGLWDWSPQSCRECLWSIVQRTFSGEHDAMSVGELGRTTRCEKHGDRTGVCGTASVEPKR